MQAVEDLGVAEEAGDIDQDIAVKGFDFLWIALQQIDVVTQFVEVIDVHAAQNASTYRCYFVIDKIDLAVVLQQPKYVLHQTLFSIESLVWRFLFRGLL